MKNSKQNSLPLWLLVGVVLVIVGGIVLLTRGAPTFGAASNQTTVGNPYAFTNTTYGVTLASSTATKLKVGASGSQITGIKFGTCTITAYATTIAATTTATVDCSAGSSAPSAISGILVTDEVVWARLASSTATTNLGLIVQDVSASTTAGYLTLKIFNGTGTTFTWSSAASSSVRYTIFH